VAYQINTLASNYIQLLDLQANNLAEMESQMNHITQTVMIHKEKVARREIGVLTANKVSTRQYKIVAPSNPEKPIKYVRKPIDYSLLDEVGHGMQLGSRQQGKRTSSQVSVQSTVPPPTTKPPTPPQMGTLRASSGPKIISNTGTLGKSRGSEYRAPPVVVPPQVPSHYAPNYPIGHPRRQNSNNSDRGPGYSSLPMPPSQQIAMHLNPNQQMVHPLQQQHSQYDDRNSMNMPRKLKGLQIPPKVLTKISF
jgi:abl interactor 2